jgi:hypothetical protein
MLEKLWQYIKNLFSKDVTEYETVRARTKDGRYQADDPSTPDVNEAYKKVAKKKTKKKKSSKKK